MARCLWGQLPLSPPQGQAVRDSWGEGVLFSLTLNSQVLSATWLQVLGREGAAGWQLPPLPRVSAPPILTHSC